MSTDWRTYRPYPSDPDAEFVWEVPLQWPIGPDPDPFRAPLTDDEPWLAEEPPTPRASRPSVFVLSAIAALLALLVIALRRNR